MKQINFELTGVLNSIEFKNDSNFKLEAEKILKEQAQGIEKISGCEVINNEFIVDILDSDTITENNIIKKDLVYKFILKTAMYSYLSHKEILDLIHKDATCIEDNLHLAVVKNDKSYEYKVIENTSLFTEAEFIYTIANNISNPEIEKLSLEIAKFDYTKDGLSIEDVMYDSYNNLTIRETKKFSEQILNILENKSNLN